MQVDFFASISKKYSGCKVNVDYLDHLVVSAHFLWLVLIHILMQVKISGPKHTYSSFNKCGKTMASNKWVAARVVDL